MIEKRIKNITLFNTVCSISLQLITIVSGFIIPRLLLETFGSEVNGLVSSLTQFLNYITIVEGGVTGVILACLYKPLSEKNKSKIEKIVSATSGFFRKIGFVFVVYTVVLAALYPIFVKTSFDYKYVSTLTLILSINLFMQYFFSLTWRTLLRADKKVYITSLVQMLCIILNTISVAVLVKFCGSIHIVKLVGSIIYVLQPLLFDLYVKKHYDIDKNAEPDKNALAQKWNGFGINVAAFIHNNTDIVVLTLFTDLKSVSIYSVYFLVTSGLKRLIQSVSEGIIPTLGHAYVSGDKKRLDKVFDTYETIIFFATFILFVSGGLLITPFVQVYTKGINDANYFHPLLGWLMILSETAFCIKEPHVNMAYSANKFKEIQKYAYIESGLNVVISVILVNKFGLIGVAVGTLIAMTFRTLVHIFYLKNNILFINPLKTLGRLAVFAVAGVLCYFISENFFVFNNISYFGWIIFAVKNTVIVMLFAILIAMLFYRDTVKPLFKGVLGKLKKGN